STFAPPRATATTCATVSGSGPTGITVPDDAAGDATGICPVGSDAGDCADDMPPLHSLPPLLSPTERRHVSEIPDVPRQRAGNRGGAGTRQGPWQAHEGVGARRPPPRANRRQRAKPAAHTQPVSRTPPAIPPHTVHEPARHSRQPHPAHRPHTAQPASRRLRKSPHTVHEPARHSRR